MSTHTVGETAGQGSRRLMNSALLRVAASRRSSRVLFALIDCAVPSDQGQSFALPTVLAHPLPWPKPPRRRQQIRSITASAPTRKLTLPTALINEDLLGSPAPRGGIAGHRTQPSIPCSPRGAARVPPSRNDEHHHPQPSTTSAASSAWSPASHARRRRRQAHSRADQRPAASARSVPDARCLRHRQPGRLHRRFPRSPAPRLRDRHLHDRRAHAPPRFGGTRACSPTAACSG